MRKAGVFTLLAAAFALLLASCGGGGTQNDMPMGRIAGSINIVGPVNSAVTLNVGLANADGTQVLESAEVGRVASTASGSLAGRNASFDFTGLENGTYTVVLFTLQGLDQFVYFDSEQITLSEGSLQSTGLNYTTSFTGPGPYGSVSGVIPVDGAFPDAADKDVFIGFRRPNEQFPVLRSYISQADIPFGRVYYNVDGLNYGEWFIGLYGETPDSGGQDLQIYGELDNSVVIGEQDPFLTNASFIADFSGIDPGTDPVFSSISGTVTISGDLPPGLLYYIGANTIPPQMGAPPGAVQFSASDISGGELDYNIEGLLDDMYGVAVFGYDFVTRTAYYFGEYSTPVNVGISEAVVNIDFTADASLIGN